MRMCIGVTAGGSEYDGDGPRDRDISLGISFSRERGENFLWPGFPMDRQQVGRAMIHMADFALAY